MIYNLYYIGKVLQINNKFYKELRHLSFKELCSIKFFNKKTLLLLYIKSKILFAFFQIIIIEYNGIVVHYTVIQNRNFQLVFNKSARKMLEIGPSWTHETNRNQGMYQSTISFINEMYPQKKFYSIVKIDNITSNHIFNKIALFSESVKSVKLLISFYLIKDY